MKKKLEVVIWPNSRKRLEFKQSLDCLAEILQHYCSSLMIDESGDGLTYTLLAQWETLDQRRQTLQSKEFSILSGAITALCDKTVIRLDDKVFNHQISDLIKQ
jgi:hypothetical protein